MMKKKQYKKPVLQTFCVLSTNMLITHSARPTGYAIDNEDADDEQVIRIREQDEDDKLCDKFIDID
ncbi:MAG: hypothetical protein IJ562_05340 [Prevotella sp.]|nr:hypothetical protein [Prevotella sp.]